LQDGTNDCFAPDAHSGRFAVPPKELPTIRSRLPLSKPQISPLITDSHGPSSSHCCIGEELMPACWGRSNVRPAGLVMLENCGGFRVNRDREQVFVLGGNRQVPLPRLFLVHNPTTTGWCLRRLPHTLTVPSVDTDEVDRSSPFGPTTSLMVQLRLLPCHSALFSTRRPTRDLSDYCVLSSTWQSPTAL
jgi:hypothetical protein